MKDDSARRLRANRVWLTEDGCDLEAFRALVERTFNPADYPFASEVVSNVLVYEGDAVRRAAASPESRREIMAEWVEAMTDGPGVIAFRGAFAELKPIEAANAHFRAMIDEQHRSNAGVGDHFAKPGANDRVWNALEKLCLADPAAFAAYYGNPIIALVSEAWLGPGYQITSQLNVVNPGGEAQVPHRDYHMGFQTAREIERFPAHAHRLSPMLTLQGAVAHCDMPLESGPTLYLPFSQTYLPGYLAAARPEFRDYFDAHKVQLPLAAGDAVFFNPALFHAAGTNRSASIKRIGNLLQVSSAYGRAMESVDRLEHEPRPLSRAAEAPGGEGDHRGSRGQRDRGLGRRLRVPDQSRPRSRYRRAGAAKPTGPDAAGAQGKLDPRPLRQGGRGAGLAEADVINGPERYAASA